MIKWIIPQLDKFPRNRRYTLGEKLENRVLTVLESLVVAAYAPNARTFLFQANRDLEVARHLWRLCYDFRVVSTAPRGNALFDAPASTARLILGY